MKRETCVRGDLFHPASSRAASWSSPCAKLPQALLCGHGKMQRWEKATPCAGAAWSMHLTWPKRACLRWLMVSIMAAAQTAWRLPRSSQSRTSEYQVSAFGSSYGNLGVSLHYLLTTSMSRRRTGAPTGHTSCRCESWWCCSVDSVSRHELCFVVNILGALLL